ncbi:MAG: 50S ribosomal protein L18 [archaeon]
MKSGPIYSVEFRRRREQKTNYSKRLAMLKSEKHRFVIRISNKLVRAQIIEYRKDGDVTILSNNSNDLKKVGWKHSLKNTPAIYLTSLLLCSNAKKKGIKEVVFDIGRNVKSGNKIFAGLKAIVDFGLDVPYSEEAFPSDDRIKGEEITKHLKNNLTKDFEEAKQKIMKM